MAGEECWAVADCVADYFGQTIEIVMEDTKGMIAMIENGDEKDEKYVDTMGKILRIKVEEVDEALKALSQKCVL